MTPILQKLQEIEAVLLDTSKEKLIGLSTTANILNPPLYISAIRETASTISANFIFRETTEIKNIIEFFDEKVSAFLIDCECKNEIFNLEEICLPLIKYSDYHLVKPNDYAVNALDELLAVLFKTLKYVTIGIVGAGNLGSKIALLAAERGAKVRLYGKDIEKTSRIVDGLNLIFKGPSKIIAANSASEAAKNAHCLIGATNGITAIDSTAVKVLSPDAILIDAGNGTIDTEAIQIAIKYAKRVYCLSCASGYEASISNWIATRQRVKEMGIKDITKDITLVSLGVMGKRGDILVNNLSAPTKIFGVCDGNGDLLQNNEASIFLERYKNLD